MLLLLIFGFPQKKNTKKDIKRYSEEIQKIIGARKGYWILRFLKSNQQYFYRSSKLFLNPLNRLGNIITTSIHFNLKHMLDNEDFMC
jgi:hypothetical protein